MEAIFNSSLEGLSLLFPMLIRFLAALFKFLLSGLIIQRLHQIIFSFYSSRNSSCSNINDLPQEMVATVKQELWRIIEAAFILIRHLY